ncbi:MAG: Ldh family oxidoreductase [Candidatus Latescibacterota bacterium]|nr:Ldh family oxidoreductase [Candidatus Latescibacterota bacterium]
MNVSFEDVVEAGARCLQQEGVEPSTAEAVVRHMATADLWGRHSHGLTTRFAAAVASARSGAGRRRPSVIDDAGARLVLDDTNGFGYGTGVMATDLLIERAGDHSLASVALRNTSHTGMLGFLADRGARAGIVTLGFTHCRPMVTPPGGKAALFGSNPIAFGFPAEPNPILVDLSTAAVTYGALLVHRQDGTTLPDGVALDEDGNPTTDAEAAMSGAMMPFGGHRGGALAAAIQLMAGVMTGAHVFPKGNEGYGLLLIGLRRDAFGAADDYDRAVAEFAHGYLATPAVQGDDLRLPGSMRYRQAQDAAGIIEIPDELAIDLGLRGVSS